MASIGSFQGQPVGCEKVQRDQNVASDDDSPKKLKDVSTIYAATDLTPIFANIPRSCRLKQRTVGKEATKVLESGDHKNEGHRSGNHLNKKQCAHKKRIKKTLAYSSDDEVIVPRFRPRGRRRGPADSSNSTTKYRKLDSKTFEGYLEDIWSRFSDEKRNSFICLDSLWFSLYMQKSFKEKVLNWVKRKNIFSKDYVMVPIVMWSHWSLLILCNFGDSPHSKSQSPCMLLLDSLQTMNPRRLEPGIRKFVFDIHNVEDRPRNKQSVRTIPLLIPQASYFSSSSAANSSFTDYAEKRNIQVPQQRNGEECGYFVLKYISLFLENAPEYISISDGYPYFMKEDWFTLEGLDNFCTRLELNSAIRESSSLEE